MSRLKLYPNAGTGSGPPSTKFNSKKLPQPEQTWSQKISEIEAQIEEKTVKPMRADALFEFEKVISKKSNFDPKTFETGLFISIYNKIADKTNEEQFMYADVTPNDLFLEVKFTPNKDNLALVEKIVGNTKGSEVRESLLSLSRLFSVDKINSDKLPGLVSEKIDKKEGVELLRALKELADRFSKYSKPLNVVSEEIKVFPTSIILDSAVGKLTEGAQLKHKTAQKLIFRSSLRMETKEEAEQLCNELILTINELEKLGVHRDITAEHIPYFFYLLDKIETDMPKLREELVAAVTEITKTGVWSANTWLAMLTHPNSNINKFGDFLKTAKSIAVTVKATTESLNFDEHKKKATGEDLPLNDKEIFDSAVNKIRDSQTELDYIEAAELVRTFKLLAKAEEQVDELCNEIIATAKNLEDNTRLDTSVHIRLLSDKAPHLENIEDISKFGDEIVSDSTYLN